MKKTLTNKLKKTGLILLFTGGIYILGTSMQKEFILHQKEKIKPYSAKEYKDYWENKKIS